MRSSQKCKVSQSLSESTLREEDLTSSADIAPATNQPLFSEGRSLAQPGVTNFLSHNDDGSDTSPCPRGPPSVLPAQLPSTTTTLDGLVIEREVSNRLLHAYFAFIHPVWPIIYKPAYDSVNVESLSTLLPQPVLYAIYSIAACLKFDAEGYQRSSDLVIPQASLFFEAALLSIQCNGDPNVPSRPDRFHPLNLLRPSIESCMALTLLALQQHGCAEPSNAFMLCSLASAMAIELDLHKAKGENADPIAVQTASRLWWNLFVLDKMITCELGKPSSLRSEDSNAQFPSITESDEYQLLQFRLHDTRLMTTTKSYTMSGFQATIRITKLMETVSRHLYSRGSREIIRSNFEAAEQLRLDLWQDLNNYYASLALSSSSGVQMDVLGNKAIPPSLVTNAVVSGGM